MPSRLLLVALVAVVAAACASSAPETSSTPGSSATPLVTSSIRGGLCPDGPCGTTIVIGREGYVHQTRPTAMDLGTIPLPELTALNVAIAATDFDAMRQHRFTGQCPTASDGQELIYE